MPDGDGKPDPQAAGNGECSNAADEQTARVDPRLLERLVCPVTKTLLEYDASASELISRAAGLAYPIHSGVPLMTEDAARTLSEDERKKKRPAGPPRES